MSVFHLDKLFINSRLNCSSTLLVFYQAFRRIVIDLNRRELLFVIRRMKYEKLAKQW